MWKKILPIAAVLILGWIGLNLITGGDDDQQETVAEATDAEPAADQSDAGTDESDTTTDAEQASTDEDTESSESESAEVAATDDESEASESTEGADTETETTDATAETDTDAEATDATAEADAEPESTDATAEADAESETTDATAEADAESESTDATAETDTDSESTDATAEADAESETTETEESATSEASADSESEASTSADAETSESADSSNVVMRYPTDPETGATLYDQGMVETEVEQASEDNAVESSDSQEASASAESAESAEGTLEMRYPTDPTTGLSLLDQEMVEVLVVPTDYEAVDETETAPAEVSQEVAAVSEDTETAATAETVEESTEPTGPRYPTDPVTGASIYDQGMIGDEQTEATAEEAGVADSDDGRLPVDPVTGATIYESADASSESSEATDSTASEASSAVSFTATATERANFDLGGISRQLGKTFGITSLVLERSVDEESAKAALPQLQAASSDLDSISDQIAELPDAGRSPLNGVISSGMSKLKPLVDTTMTREGVGPVLGEVITPMLETLDELSQ
jgi:hypothetical protein